VENNLAELEVGCGLGRGEDGLAVGTEAARQAVADIERHPLSAVLAFASGRYDLEALLRGIQGVVGETPVFGATTAGEILNASRQESAVVVALASPVLRVKVGVGEGVSRNWQAAVRQAVDSPHLAPFFSSQNDPFWSELTLKGKSVFALLFSPGNTRPADSCSFEILEELKRRSQGRLPFIGGGAADDWRLENNYVFWGGRAYPDSMLLAVFETRLRFGIGLSHGFTPSARRAVVTRAMDHEVRELDGQPAAGVYCRLLGVSRDSLARGHLTMATGNPLGIADPYGQYSVNVATFFTPEGGVRLAQPVPEGTSLTVMEAHQDRLVGAGQEALRKALLRGGISEPAVALVFSGALRARLLKDRADEELAVLKQMIPGAPVVGFYSFGEQGLDDNGANRHQNGVIAVLALGRELSYGAQVALENERLRSVAAQRDALLRANQALEREIAQRRRVAAALQESEERFKLLFDSAPDALFIHDLQGNLIDGNQAAEDMVGYRREELIGKNFLTLPLLDPEQISMVTQLLAQTVQGKTVGPVEHTLNRKDDGKVIVEIKSLPVNIHGENMVLGIARDITERKRLENQLIQAQKMEAVGRLAGGVAHDFNNLLMAIMGYCEIMVAELHPEDPLHASVRKIIEVAERAAALTRQLLAFSRKQILYPRVIDLNIMLTNLENMLQRLLGEDLDLDLDLASGPAAVRADPGQMGQVIMNLAVNARDAMPRGGRLLIATALVHLDGDQSRETPGVPPGPYVKLTVRDNGVGMDPETRAHVFEPFFTTKEVGRGTGLGLSTVYGIIRQSGGYLEVESELGRGTTFQIYLPRIGAAPEVVAPATDVSPPAQGSETVLVVEDEDVLRGVVSKFLRRFGYNVLAARHGGDALLLCERHPDPIHLLLTDVVMPQMSGRELAERLASLRPDMRVLFMSGYTADELDNHGGPELPGPLLQKPFNPMVLAHKVRELLDPEVGSPGLAAPTHPPG
jgi:PAS domain S-box-containing protein